MSIICSCSSVSGTDKSHLSVQQGNWSYRLRLSTGQAAYPNHRQNPLFQGQPAQQVRWEMLPRAAFTQLALLVGGFRQNLLDYRRSLQFQLQLISHLKLSDGISCVFCKQFSRLPRCPLRYCYPSKAHEVATAGENTASL